MTDRWTRAEERYRQREADRRYRRDDAAWERSARSAPAHDEWDDYDDDTAVIPRYTDDEPAYDEFRSAAGESGAVEPAYADYPEDPDHEQPTARGRRSAAAAGRPARTESAARPRGSGKPRPSGRTADGGRTRSAAGRARAEGAAGRSRGKGAAGRPERSGRPQPKGRKASRAASRKAAERERRRHTTWVLAAVFVLLLGGAGTFAVMKLTDDFAPAEDFAGPPGPLVVVRVHPGDTASQIAKSMYDKGVVASADAFFEAAVRNSGMNAVQPGYYQIPSRSPAADAVAALLGKNSRVGNLVISEGRQLHDQHDVNTGARKEGIYTKIADASCVGTGAERKCVTYEELDAAGASADLAGLGVPSWAEAAVRAAPDRRRQIEGLIAAGTWDFDPSGSPQQILRELITASAAGYESTGLLQSGANTQLSPYETLIAASLVEREALPQDMPKVARVIINRLKIDQPLQFDSTVNYSLDRTEVATTDSDRATVTPWNTYAMAGLPANPIAAPSLNALRAVENPEPGNWLYFVTIDQKGTTLFTESYAEHLRNIDKAMESGILDSGR
ncbi:endolytic transglycosylase MltG [Nocardia farcinica]|uniref:Endolytic murein transglycosylase n=2 Tax=Nocardia farcinica TaxID=37329 RepID=A0A0H5NFB3_NOCFR|nr:endolytic transglycosylase MltG [Nocardia farcinica]AXK88984.1 endolytic transglycosylase MltG [Nocardia farcinica]MBA4859282.1 endolytic transglycosylase MltG [Nocardia farcinica]MBC9816449.1 endolytic transglycosylase MltG [Nocardia farcinica]MBF6139473.1 endolytic transglycosylase MltG [Nocardia farcinica]MBF6229852.1 endolytic transglycosylase MltG [Nocardia farcinica]